MADPENFRERERECRRMADLARDPDLKWLYDTMARHYADLVARGAYDADARTVQPLGE